MRIAVYCYPCTEDVWSPHSLSDGIGGSEEAVIHMASALAERGHDVTVTNARSGPPRRFAGVTWDSYDAPRRVVAVPGHARETAGRS